MINIELILFFLKYFFVILTFLFISSVIRLIYLDITDTSRYLSTVEEAYAYLKLINLKEAFSFKVYESYGIGESTTIGRKRNCDIRISCPYLSKMHARIFLYNNKFYVEDLGSTNGTFVGKHQVLEKPVRIKDGDKLSFGGLSFLFVEVFEEPEEE
ncbi:MAG: FHA domain-containing protein [Ruminococcaceae bacterium]|nr:FHA domain-containing protein [Oscillospiraceae bacterium]